MIEKYVSDIAAQLGMHPPNVSLVDGRNLGCVDTHLVNISAKGRVVSALVFRTDFENLIVGAGCDRMEIRIRLALSRLQMILETSG